MLTTAITGAIGGVLAAMGIEPGAYLAGVWVGVKLVIAGVALLIGRKALKARRQPEA